MSVSKYLQEKLNPTQLNEAKKENSVNVELSKKDKQNIIDALVNSGSRYEIDVLDEIYNHKEIEKLSNDDELEDNLEKVLTKLLMDNKIVITVKTK
jgi:hypothetical protein